MQNEDALHSLETLDAASRQPLRYWNIDGLAELSMGLVWIVWGLLMVGAQLSPPGILRGVLVLAGVMALVGGSFAGKFIVQHLKQRITYPRTGYLKMQTGNRFRRAAFAFLLSLLVGAVIAAIATVRNDTTDGLAKALPLIVGIILAAAFAVAGRKHAHPRFIVLAFTALACGVVLFAAHVEPEWAFPYFFLSLGVVSALSGAITLRRYLRAHPVPEALK